MVSRPLVSGIRFGLCTRQLLKDLAPFSPFLQIWSHERRAEESICRMFANPLALDSGKNDLEFYIHELEMSPLLSNGVMLDDS